MPRSELYLATVPNSIRPDILSRANINSSVVRESNVLSRDCANRNVNYIYIAL